MKKLRITVEGKAYEVLVEILDEAGSPTVPPRAVAPVLAAPAAAAPRAATPAVTRGAGGSGEVVSPLAGKVVSLDVRIGQTVAEGAQVATVEAMKMNTYIYASKAGTVSEILVNPGDGVEEGAVLLRIG